MENTLQYYLSLFILILIILSTTTTTTTTLTAATTPKHNLVRKSCVNASYPSICLRSLSSCGAAATTPADLAQVAVKVSLTRLRRASNFLSHLKGGGRTKGALTDCVEQIGDSVDELSKALSAPQHLLRCGGAEFEWQMNNAETWVSAALSNEDTCLDGFVEIVGGVRLDVRRRIGNVARVTSNALYLINLLDKPRRSGIKH